MTNTIEIKINKTVFKFIETVYKEKTSTFIKRVDFSYRNTDILIKIRGDEHNPAHVHIFYLNSSFFFDLEKQDVSISDKRNKEFLKFKNNKYIYKAVFSYLQMQKEYLIKSFYSLNPNLKSNN